VQSMIETLRRMRSNILFYARNMGAADQVVIAITTEKSMVIVSCALNIDSLIPVTINVITVKNLRYRLFKDKTQKDYTTIRNIILACLDVCSSVVRTTEVRSVIWVKI